MHVTPELTAPVGGKDKIILSKSKHELQKLSTFYRTNYCCRQLQASCPNKLCMQNIGTPTHIHKIIHINDLLYH